MHLIVFAGFDFDRENRQVVHVINQVGDFT